jgi:putative ABC transport system permease protein
MSSPAQTLRLCRWLLCLYPAEFRDHFSQEVCLVFEDRLREHPGPAALALMYFALVFDACKEHYHMVRQDLIYTWRSMRRDKLASSIAVIVLALGIGASTTVFTLFNGMLLRPLPYPRQERIVYVEEVSHDASGLRGAVAYPNYLDMQARNRSLEAFAMFGSGLATIRGDFDAERVPAAFVTEPIFRVLGVAPLMGRTFTPEEDRPKGGDVVVLGEDLWRRKYGADPHILGKTITIGTDPTRIIGVMPRGFHFPDLAQLWLPAQMDTATNKRTDHGMEGIGLLRPGFSTGQAQSDLRAIMRQIVEENPTETYHQTVNLYAYRARDTKRVQPVLYTLLGAVGFVLLIACANIANLLLVKAAARKKEIAVRAAIGASRSRLVRQFVIESLVLGGLGAVLGAVFAFASVPALLSLVPDTTLPRWIAFPLDGRTLAFAIGVSLGTALLVGLAPAISGSRLNVADSLKEGGRANTGSAGGAWLRGALVIVEVSLSVVLLAGAGLMIRSFLNLHNQNIGFHAEHVTAFQTALPNSRYPQGEKAAQGVRGILEQLRAIPGVAAVAGASSAPLLGGWGRSLTVENRPLLSLKDAPLINHTVVTPGYFNTLGIPILEGRDFTDADAKDPRITIVDVALARQYWPNESPLGKRVRFGPPEDNEPWHTVVGVVGEARNQSVRAIRRHSVYLPYGEFRFANLAYLVRTAPATPDPMPAVRSRITTFDRTIAISGVVALQDAVDRSIWQERFFAMLLAAFGGLALLLAVAGLYGVLAYTVAQRRHEMGIRMALGASASQIRGMVLAHSGRLAGMGLLAGAIGALLLTRLLETQLYEIQPGDPATLAIVAILLGVAAMAASYLPARRATSVDPMCALRDE